MAFECVPEHGLAGDAFGSRIECRRQPLQGLFPPVGNQPSAHRHQLVGTAVGGPHNLDGVGLGDVVMRLQVPSRSREVIQVVDLGPRLALGEASAHIAVVYGKVAAAAPAPHRDQPLRLILAAP